MKFILALLLTVLVGCGGYLSMSQKRLFEEMVSWWDDEPQMKRQLYRDPENCFLVLGTVVGETGDIPLHIAAVEISGERSEVVAKRSIYSKEDFLLYLPKGKFRFMLFADLNGDSTFTQYECLAVKERELINSETNLHLTFTLESLDPIVISQSYNEKVGHVRSMMGRLRNGGIEQLDSPLFSDAMGELGLFDPASFLEKTGTLFFTTAPRNRQKTPVLFVHGITGTPADFSTIVSQIDTTHFEPWFFFYPTGVSLETSSELLYDLFLSGNYINLKGSKMIVVAHSMGGLVARRAINRYVREENRGGLVSFITLSTPYDGNAAAAKGVKHAPYTVPSWVDIAEGSDYIESLSNVSIKDNIDFRLFFSYGDTGPRSGDNSDGVISLKSQLKPQFQSEATRVEGFNESHTSILTSETVINRLNETLSEFM